MVQRLHERGVFHGDPALVRDEVGRCFDELVQEAAMMLLGQGKSFERANIERLREASRRACGQYAVICESGFPNETSPKFDPLGRRIDSLGEAF